MANLGMVLQWPWTSCQMVAALVTILATVCVAVQNLARRSTLVGMAASLPVIGDSIHLLRGTRSFLLDSFARYGDLFNVSVMGQKVTVANTPEAIRFVLSTAHKSLPPGPPKTFSQLFGANKYVAPSFHPHLRKATLQIITGDGLQSLLPFINYMAEKTVKSWGQQKVVNTDEEAQKFAFTMGMYVVWRDIEPGSEEMELFRKAVSFLIGGIGVLPINLPGFYFHKALKTNQMMLSRIQEEISKRRATGSQVNDFLSALMSIKDVEIPDNDMCCIILNLMFASSVTTAPLISWVVKHLHDFPEVRQRVQEEQEAFRRKIAEEKSLTWFKPKSSMPYTLQVINETLRMDSPVTFIPRQANKDVDYNGHVFRKGSNVWISPFSVMSNPDYYPNPQNFDPSRFEEKPKPNTFLVFGQGPYMCPGSDLAFTETMFLIHHLVTNYSWERCGPDQGVVQMPLRKPRGGFPITLTKRHVDD